MRPLPTAPLAAASLIGGYAVVVASGSRPLGGLVMLAGGLCCIGIWNARHGRRTAATLAGVGVAAFIGSHVLAPAIGPWPSVLLVSALTAAATWNLADARVALTPESPSAR